jgi:hypothetical protein
MSPLFFTSQRSMLGTGIWLEKPPYNPEAVARHLLIQAPVASPVLQRMHFRHGMTAGMMTSFPTHAGSPATTVPEISCPRVRGGLETVGTPS